MNRHPGLSARFVAKQRRRDANRRLSIETLEARALLAADLQLPVMLPVANADVDNAPPIAQADFYIIDDNDVLITDDVTGLLVNDRDADGDPLRVSQIVEPPIRGSLTVEDDGGFTYRPRAIGIDTFVYEVVDAVGATDTAAVTIVINRSVGTPPIAQDDQYTVVEGSRMFIRSSSGVLANDVGQSTGFTATPILFPSNGLLDLQADGAFAYVPTPGFIGTDQFTYELSEEETILGQATVTIQVESAGDTPTIMGTVAQDQDGDGEFDLQEVVEGATVQLFVDDGDGMFEPGEDDVEAAAPVRTELGGFYGFSSLSPDHAYFVVQPMQQVGDLTLPEQVSRLVYPGEPGILIDSFESPQTVIARPPAPKQAASMRTFPSGETEVIGVERDLSVSLETGEGGLQLGANSGGSNGTLQYRATADAQGLGVVTWNGIDDDPQNIGNGLGGRDLTMNGSQQGIAFWANAGTTGAVIEIRLIQGESMSIAERPVSFNGLSYQVVPFAEFAGQADPSRVDAIQLVLKIDAPGGDQIEFDTLGTMGPKTIDFFSNETRAEVSVTNTNDDDTVYVGDDVSYTITVSNAGPDDVVAASFLNEIPAGLENVVYSSVTQGIVSGNTDAGTGSISDTLDLAARSSVTYTLTGTVAASAVGELTSQAAINLPANVFDSDLSNNVDIDGDEIIREVDLSVVKINGQDFASPGDIVEYTVFVTNRGPADVNQVSIVDEMPDMLVDVRYTSEASQGIEGNTEQGSGDIRDLINLPHGGNVTYLITARIRQDATGELTNVVSVDTTDAVVEVNLANNVATDTDALFRTSDLEARVSTSQTDFVPGEAVSFVVEIENAGPTDAESATILDAFGFPFEDVTFSSVASLGATGNTENGSDFIDDIVMLPAGSMIRYDIQATVAPNATGTLLNEVSVIPGVNVIDPNPGNNGAELERSLTPVSDLSVEIEDGVDSVELGAEITYVIVVQNDGPSDVVGARIIDLLPSQLEDVDYFTETLGAVEGHSESGTGSIDDVVSMAVGSRLTYRLTAVVARPGSLDHRVEVRLAPTFIDPNLDNNLATDLNEIMVPDRVDLAVDLVADPASVVAGEQEDYRMVLTLSNTGPDAARLVQVDGQWPAELELDSLTVPQGSLTRTDEGYRWEIDSLAAGASLTLDLPYSVPFDVTNQTLMHHVTVGTDSIDGDLGNNQADINVDVQANADLRLELDDDLSQLIAGDASEAFYVVQITNDGPSLGGNSEVEVSLPDEYSLAEITPTIGSIDITEDGLVWTFEQLAPTNEARLMIAFDVDSEVVPGEYRVEATVASLTMDGDLTNNHAVDLNQVRSVVDLSIRLDDDVSEIVAGASEQYSFEVTVENSGPSLARQVLVRDLWPSTYSIVGFDPAVGEVVEVQDGFEWRIDALAAGDVTFLRITYTVDLSATSGNHTNEVSVSSSADELNDANNSAADTNLIHVSSIRGTIWNDADGDGTWDPGESPVEDWFLFVDLDKNGRHDEGEPSAVTDVNGEYEFSVVPGSHHVRQSVLSGWEPTSPARFSMAASLKSRRDAEITDVATDLVTGDFNQDGQTDVAILNEFSNRIVVFSRAESGVFEETFSMPVGLRPRSLTTVDFDLDGDLDIALTALGGRSKGPAQDHGVTILSNNGQGQFANKQFVRAGKGPQDVVTLDVDGDGDLDLAIANVHSGTVTILTNREGRYASVSTLDVGESPTSIGVADLNLDGQPDLVVANFGSDQVQTLVNRNGRFVSKDRIRVGDGPASVTSLDADGDGDADLAVANFLSDDVSVLINDGAADFDTMPSLPLSRGARPSSILAHDLNADGDIDLLISNAELDEADLVFGVGDGSFSRGLKVSTGLGPHVLALSDFDADGATDLATIVIDVDPLAAGMVGGVAVLANDPSRIQVVDVAVGESKHQVDFGNLRYRETSSITSSRTLSAQPPLTPRYQRSSRPRILSSSGRQWTLAEVRHDRQLDSPNQQHRIERQRRFLERQRVAAIDQALDALVEVGDLIEHSTG